MNLNKAMDIQFEDLRLKSKENSFVAYTYETERFPFYLHYHPEYELLYIEKGNGQRVIGDLFTPFSDGELALLAPNIPHTWSGYEVASKATVIQFSEKLIRTFSTMKEFESIKQLLDSVDGALIFKNVDTNDIKKISTLKGISKLTCLFEILDYLSLQPSEKILASTSHFSRETENRINKVCLFIQQNIQKQLDLSEVASLIYLSDSAFCKFFKRTTGKTFTEYVNLVRIEAISNKLLYTDLPINQIASYFGYESQTYFNRIFKKLKGCSPAEFRKSIKIAEIGRI